MTLAVEHDVKQKINLNNKIILNSILSVSREYLKIGLIHLVSNNMQISGPKGVPYFRMTINPCIKEI